MGELSDDLVDGVCCEQCGQYFGNPYIPDSLYDHGYPAICWECWPKLSKRERKGRQRAEVPLIHTMDK